MRSCQAHQKVWFIGNSLTAGYDAGQDNKRYSDIVVQHLRTLRLLAADIVQNYNIYGGAIHDGIRQALASSCFGPDVVILQLGENDHPYDTGHIQLYRQLVEILTSEGRQPLLCFLGVWNPSEGDNSKYLSEDIRQLAIEKEGVFVDLAAISANPAHRQSGRNVAWLNDAAHLVSDTFHPNDEGHFAIAQAVIWAVEPIIRRGLRRRLSSPRAKRTISLRRF